MRVPFRGVPSEEIGREAERTLAGVRAEMRAVQNAAMYAEGRFMGAIARDTETPEDWNANLPSHRRAGRPGEDS